MRTIVVEDTAGLREIVTGLLRGRGHDVTPFPDAESAWEAMAKEPFDLAVLDWGLPGMDGLELCRRFRARPGGAGFVLFLTGRAEPEDIAEAIDAGANDYVAKPFRLETLELRVAFAERQAQIMTAADRARRRFADSERRFRELIERLPIVTYVERLAPDESVLYVSPQIETLLGWPAATFVGRSDVLFELIHPEDRERLVREFHAVRRPGGHFSSEYRVRAKDGSYRWFADDAFIEAGPEPGELLWHGVLADVTDRRQAEDALRESERQQRALAVETQRQATELRLLDRIRSALARELEPAVIYKTVAEATAEFLGYPYVSVYLIRGEQMVLQSQIGYANASSIYTTIPRGKGVIGRVVTSGAPALIADVRTDPDFLGSASDLRSEICVPLRDGTEIVGVLDVETRGDRTLDENDLRLLVALGDHVESALSRTHHYTSARSHAERLNSVLESVQEVIFQADGDARWTFLNPAWEEITGFPVAACIGRRITDFVVQADLAEKAVALYDLTRGARSEYRSDVRMLNAAGQVRWLACHVSRATSGGPPYPISGTLIDITERKQIEEALRESQDRYRQLAMHDPLTALPNRSCFMERLEETLRRDGPGRSVPLAVLFLDLDGFKLVNDSFGHDAGDRLLAVVADRLRTCVQAEDTVARFGGDEFAVLVPWAESAQDVAALAGRILEELRKPCTLLGQDIAISASIGIVLHTPGEASGTELLRNADTALYAAKGDGRNSYTFYAPEMSTAVFARLRQETELRGAIDREDLLVYYQPTFALETGEIAGLEALVRWQHPKHALLPPDAFINLAEATGLIVPLGNLVLRRVCEQARAWRTHPAAERLKMSVNLSAGQLRQSGLAEEVAALLDEYGLPPAMLELEITESALIADGPAVQQTLGDLRTLGVSLAIDDFGTGYASLSSLRDLPVTGVKIDRSFTAGLGHDRASAAIIGAVVGMAKELGLAVTAEGIETLEQLAHLRSLGIPYGQGYYYTRPLPAEALEPFILGDSPVNRDLLLATR